ncbi:polymeric immunoglobulin receptor-like [Morone saxatilis]|uniref:polymeric immunoglobulin receptor-like n=1 Tax=Morone saxatilis TaxID=34816 RepID=UPI0015E20E98|nr:polymeric immunoglobulin receptor-like [Morone saxatilis]
MRVATSSSFYSGYYGCSTSVVASVIFSAVVCWGGGTNKLGKLVKKAKMIGLYNAFEGTIIKYVSAVVLSGIHSQVTKVSKVSVKAGGSISIPCLYEPKYRYHVKYLCEGQNWPSCTYAIKSNQPSSGKFSISDDKQQRIFTVTINNLMKTDTYWCAVEKFGFDVKQSFQLSVETGTSSLYVDQQKINAFERGSVTVMCHYKHQKVTKWCRLGSTCVTGQTGSIDGTPVTINASVTKVFTVTMSGLRTESSGWYWCANKDFQIPVHITVQKLTSTTTTMSPTTRISVLL